MKKYLLLFAVVVIAIGFSAFTGRTDNSKKTSPTSAEWFELIPGGNPANANDYRPVGGQPCDGGSPNVCGVFVIEDPENEDRPDLDASPVYVYKNL